MNIEKNFNRREIGMPFVGPSVMMAQRMSEISSILVFFGGCIVLLGWIFDVPVFKSILPGLVVMKANTAACFVMTGMALWCLQEKRVHNILFRTAAVLFSAVILSIGLATFCEYAFNCDMRIDQFLFQESSDAILTSSPGRMAFNTAINFVLIGMALLFSRSRNIGLNIAMQFLALIVSFLSFLSLIGYFYNASPLYLGLKLSTAMALHVAIMFVLSGFGILFLRSKSGLMSQVTSEFTGGKVLRRLLPIAMAVPVILGFFVVRGEELWMLDNKFGGALVAVSNLFIMTLYIYVFSVFLNRLDIKRKETEEALLGNVMTLKCIVRIKSYR